MTDWLNREDFRAARRRVAGAVHRTPLLPFRTLGRSHGTSPWLKCENLQKTGSFKVRGALNAIETLSRRERARGRDHDLGPGTTRRRWPGRRGGRVRAPSS